MQPTLQDLRRAIRAAALGAISAGVTAEDAARMLAAEMTPDTVSLPTAREAAKAAYDARRSAILAELEQRADERGIAGKLARKHARDPRDAVEVESLERSIRRWMKNFRTVSGCARGQRVDSAHG